MTKLLTKAEVCELFAISQSTLDRIVASGKLRGVKISGRLRFEQQELDRYVESCRTRLPAPPPAMQRRSSRSCKVKADCGYYPGMKVV